MTEKRWIKKEYPQELVDSYSETFNISKILSKILLSRGINSIDKAKMFLSPTMKDLINPDLLSGIIDGAERVHSAIKTGEKIVIFGDYDVDGMTSTTVIYNFFKDINYNNIDIYLPNRISDRYGLTKKAIDEIKLKKGELIITVDCGSSNHEEIRYAKEKNIDVIVTDHHQVAEDNLPAVAFINPVKPGEKFPYKFLAGVGVAFYFIMGLRKYLRENGFFKNIKEPNLKEYLDLVAIGTVADIVPLTGLNRTLVTLGLEILSHTNRPGLKAIFQIAGIKDKIDTFTIGYVIAPRLNATARLGDTYKAFNLLAGSDYNKCIIIARELEDINKQRKDLEYMTLEEAVSEIKKKQEDTKSIVLYNDNWHPGIIGLVANHIASDYNKPTFILCRKNENFFVGSGRSISGINLFEVLKSLESYFDSYGGHSFAAGLTIDENKILDFSTDFENIIDDFMKDKELIEDVYYDTEINSTDLNKELLEEIKRLEPFGEQNPEPVFKISNFKVTNKKYYNQRHISLSFFENGQYFNAIGFNWNGIEPKYDDYIDLFFSPKLETYKNKERIKLRIRGIEKKTN